MSASPDTPGSDSIDFMGAAMRYARDGWRVLPVHPGEKRPALAGWPERASSDPETVRDWWVQNPEANIGLALGSESWVLDIDPDHGGADTLAELEATHGRLPLTRTVTTPSGGRHYYFLLPDDFTPTNSPGRLKHTGIDVRGDGGQVLAPPSVTVTGAYELDVSAPIAAPPEWLVDLIRPRLEVVPDPGGPTPDRIDADDLDAQREHVERVILPAAVRSVREETHERNNRLNNEVLALAGIAAISPDLLDRDTVLAEMLAACEANGLLADDGRRSFTATFASAWQAGLERPRQDWPPRLLHAGLGFGPAPSDRPRVNVSSRKLNELTDEVLGHIVTANEARPRLFDHGTEVVQVVGQPAHTRALDKNMLAYVADEHIDFTKAQPKGGTAVAQAPTRMVDTIMAMPEKGLPPLDRVAFTPFFSPSGRYVSTPGYDAESRVFLAPALGLHVPEVPTRPTTAETRAARSLLVDEALGDFPFVDEADRAHAVALLLLPFVRSMIDGATPLHNIEAPTPGSGKGLLMKTLLMPAVGGRHKVLGAAPDNEEWEKRLVSSLRLTPQALVIDNVNEKITSGFLCTALTEPEVSSRLLGASQEVTVPVRCAWVMTANNPQFSDEVARRTIRIRLDAQTEHPEDLSGFRHPDLQAWAAAHRGELIAAACTLVQSWVVAGAPTMEAAKPFGSFEAWQATMGGLLDHIGVPGLLDNKADFMAASDDETSAWAQLVEILSVGEAEEWSAATLAEIVRDAGLHIDAPSPLAMGKELARQRGRFYLGKHFTFRTKRGCRMWVLEDRPRRGPDL